MLKCMIGKVTNERLDNETNLKIGSDIITITKLLIPLPSFSHEHKTVVNPIHRGLVTPQLNGLII
jgi:hypothetical protein